MDVKELELLADKIAGEAGLHDKWIDVTEDQPPEWVSVQGHIAIETQCPSVRECFRIGNEYYFPALREKWPVDVWKPFSSPPALAEKCNCLRTIYGKDVCYGTKEVERCSCGGDRGKCNFY